MLRSRRIAGPLFSVAASVLAVTVAGAAAPAMAAAPTGPASPVPVGGTPQLAPRPSGATEQIRQLVKCGDMMYAVGKFHNITQGGNSYVRHNAFSFLAAPPFTVSSWKPSPNGEVNSIAFRSGNCSSAYLGGSFTRVHKRSARNIAKVSTSTGAIRNRFRHDANDTVETLVVHTRDVLAGGFFTSINGSGRNYYASLNSKTGHDDRYLRLRISGHFEFPNVMGNRTRVYNQQLSPTGRRLLVEGDFTSVRGKSRQQIFMLTLRSTQAKVTKWRSSEFKQACSTDDPFYIHAASWSPDSSTIFIADTGFAPFDLPNTSARTGLCDAAAAFPSSDRAVGSEWINYTGCDSLYSTAADGSTVYFGGHERWTENGQAGGCDAAGPGSIPEQGMEALSPSSGQPINNPPAYSRSQGIGADDMLVTNEGLWIASDNFTDSDGAVADKCDAMAGFAGICLLPYN
jgi:hypothetical protein